MPTETPEITGMAALIDPMGTGPVALDPEEFTALRNLLRIFRDERETAMQGVLQWLLMCREKDPPMDIRGVWGSATYHFLAEVDDAAGGLITDRFGKVIETVSDLEWEVLKDTLATVRLGGWLSDWLALQVSSIASGDKPGDRFPSPLQIMGTLTDDLKEFQDRANHAREFQQMRPDLFPATSTAPADVEPAQDPTPAPAKPQAARKGRSKTA